jgi:hypothetical protein
MYTLHGSEKENDEFTKSKKILNFSSKLKFYFKFASKKYGGSKFVVVLCIFFFNPIPERIKNKKILKF